MHIILANNQLNFLINIFFGAFSSNLYLLPAHNDERIHFWNRFNIFSISRRKKKLSLIFSVSDVQICTDVPVKYIYTDLSLFVTKSPCQLQ